MKGDSKLSLALHALGHMAQGPGPLTSEVIATHNGSNPAFVRRVLGRLREAGLVRSEKGHAGGWQLAREASSVTVADVYRALGEATLRMQPLGAPPGCSVEAALRGTLTHALAEAEATLLARLEEVSIAQLAQAMG